MSKTEFTSGDLAVLSPLMPTRPHGKALQVTWPALAVMTALIALEIYATTYDQEIDDLSPSGQKLRLVFSAPNQ